jgi:hypothetical protein
MTERNLESTYPKGPAVRQQDDRTKAERQADARAFVNRPDGLSVPHPPSSADSRRDSAGGHRGVKLDKTLRDCSTGHEGNPQFGHDNTLTTPNTRNR